jgi:hypothetical protein
MTDRPNSIAEIHTADPAATTPAAAAAPDPFDLDRLRLAQNFNETVGVKKLLTTVPVRKPHKQDFVRVHRDAAYRENFSLIELKEDNEQYLFGDSGLAAELAPEISNVTLFTTINRQNVVFLWPVRLPGPDGKDMDWWRSGREAAAEAMEAWVRVTSNKSLGAYEITTSKKVTSEPTWPEASFLELIKIAFRDRLITSVDHPVVKRLRGLA